MLGSVVVCWQSTSTVRECVAITNMHHKSAGADRGHSAVYEYYTMTTYKNSMKEQCNCLRCKAEHKKERRKSACLKEKLLPCQSMLGDLTVLPAKLLHASPLPVVLIENVQRSHLCQGDTWMGRRV